MPQVSVIMPVFNMAQESDILQTAVDSIKNQTYQDWELLICDDGSADGTLQELRKLAHTDKRIRILYSLKNHKAGWARNACIRAARGRFIAIMDADDIADVHRLEIQTNFLNRHPEYAFVGSHAWMLDDRGIWGLRRMEAMPDVRSFLDTLPFVHPSVLLRTEVVRAVHGYRQTPAFYRVEDYEFLMRLYAYGYRGYNIQKPLLSYREDARAYHRRKYRYRITECRMRYRGFQSLGILHGNLYYVIKPLAAGLIPAFIMRKNREKRFRMQEKTKNVLWCREKRFIAQGKNKKKTGKNALRCRRKTK